MPDRRALLVLDKKAGRNGDPKRYDIVRAVEATHDEALADLPRGEYVIIELDSLVTYEVGYVTIQQNNRKAT